jgi:hypothetical protein
VKRAEFNLSEAYGINQGRPIAPDGTRHDATAGIVYGAKVLGLESRNGKQYLREAVRKALPMLEGIAGYVDHPSEKSFHPAAKTPRSIRDRFFRLRNVVQGDDGNAYADIHYRTKHWFAEQFADLVDNDPVGIGLSINAYGFGTTGADGKKIVDEITKIHSVDLVDDPATCVGLWESYMDTSTPTLDSTTGMTDTNTGDWKKELCDAISALAKGVSDGSVDMGTAKKKITALLKHLDDGGTDAEPGSDSEMMEQLREIALPVARKAVKRLDTLLLEQRVQERKKHALDAGLPPIALTEQFVADLTAASDKNVSAMILDRKKLIASVRGPISPAPSPFEGEEKHKDHKKSVEELSVSIFG